MSDSDSSSFGSEDEYDDTYDAYGEYDGSNAVVASQKKLKRKNKVASNWWVNLSNNLAKFNKFSNADKEYVCQNRKLSMDEIEGIKAYFNETCWSLIFKHQDLTNEFIDANIEKMDKTAAIHLYEHNRFFTSDTQEQNHNRGHWRRYVHNNYTDVHNWVKKHAKFIMKLIPEHGRFEPKDGCIYVYLKTPNICDYEFENILSKHPLYIEEEQ